MSASRKRVYEGKFLSLFEESGWEFVKRTNCTGMVVMIGMTDDRKVILVEQLRVPIAKRVVEFPAGLVNDLAHIQNETLEQAALREYEEETGYRAEKMVSLLSAPANPALSVDHFTLFRATGLKKHSAGGGDGSENITVHEVPLSEIQGWLDRMREGGALIDIKVYAGLYFLSQDLK